MTPHDAIGGNEHMDDMTNEKQFTKEELKAAVKAVVEALNGKLAADIEIIDIGGVSVIADYFVVASAQSQNQLHAMQDAADEAMYKLGFKAKSIEGNRQSTWILMDYGDIIVHLFSAEDRLFYNLEKIWSDGKRISPEEL
jgi:ribosome-associated protein